MGANTATVCIEGGDVMHRAIKSLAAEDGVPYSRSLRIAAEAYWGQRLKAKIDSLLVEDGLRKVQMGAAKSNE